MDGVVMGRPFIFVPEDADDATKARLAAEAKAEGAELVSAVKQTWAQRTIKNWMETTPTCSRDPRFVIDHLEEISTGKLRLGEKS